MNIDKLAEAIHALGVNHAMTPHGSSMGAIELLAVEVRNSGQTIADAINNLADAVREAGADMSND